MSGKLQKLPVILGDGGERETELTFAQPSGLSLSNCP